MTRPLHTDDIAPRRRPPRSLNVVRDVGYPVDVDWSSWYLTDEDDMGQNPAQSKAIEVLFRSAPVRLAELGREDAFVGFDAFFAWVEAEPLVRVSPDLYVLPERPEPMPLSFQTWRDGHEPPELAVEIVSSDWKKDYEDNPAKYAQLGVRELVIFDAAAMATRRPEERFVFQVYRRSVDGLLIEVYRGPGPAWSKTLDAFFVAVAGVDGWASVPRLSYDAAGRDLIPTLAEKVARERDEAARERDEERARREDAEARIRELEARLAELNE